MKPALLIMLVFGLTSCATPHHVSIREARQQYHSIHHGMALSDIIQRIGEPEKILSSGDLQWKYEDFAVSDFSTTLILSVHLDGNERVETARVEQSTSRYPHIEPFPTPVRN